MPVALAVSLLVLSAAPVKVAAPGLTGVRLDQDRVQFLSERFAHGLVSPSVTVITSAEIAALLGLERQKQMMGCASDASSCSAELSNALGADALLTGEIARIGNSFQVNLKILRTKDGALVAQRALKAATEEDLSDDLLRAGQEMSVEVADAFATTIGGVPSVARRGSKARSFSVPLLVGGWAVAAAGAVLFAVGKMQGATITGATPQMPISLADARSAQGLGSVLEPVGIVCLTVGAAVGVAGIGLLLFGQSGEANVHVSLAPGYGGFSVTGVW